MPATARTLHAVELGTGDQPDIAQPDLTPDERALAWLQTEADDNILICRGRGPRHGFDPLIRGKVLRYTWSIPLVGERYRLVQLCPDCRLVWRELVTAGGGVIGEPAKWRLWWDERYKPPKGVGRIKSSAARQEAARRMAEDGTLANLTAKPIPKHVAAFVAASDIRAADREARKRRRAAS